MRAKTVKKILIPSEAQEQMALVKWLSYHPVLKDCFCKNDNEGKRSPAQGRILKLMGLRPGVSDLFIYYPTNTFSGLWLEVKRNRKYSKSEGDCPVWVRQQKFQDRVKSVGFAAFFCFGWEHGKEIIENYLLT